jgi:Polyketide cyclase / dehydrase and lipid transport
MNRALVVLACVVAAAAGILLTWNGVYGWTMFVILPFAIGAAGAAIGSAKTAWSALGCGALAGFMASFSLLMFGIEGFGCVMMSWPLVIPGGAAGGLLFHAINRSGSSAQSVAMLALLPMGSLGWDFTAKPTVFEVHSSIEIAAPPETVWRNVVTFSDIPEPREWFFHTGLAYPKRARIEGTGPGAVRYCEFSTGPFVEPIKVWNEPRLLRFSVTSNPPPMHEWSPYGDVHPKHLDGYMISKQGQFLLTPLANGGTLLEGTTWYQHGLWPAQYWRVWSDAIIHRIHMRVLRHIKELSEG